VGQKSNLARLICETSRTGQAQLKPALHPNVPDIMARGVVPVENSADVGCPDVSPPKQRTRPPPPRRTKPVTTSGRHHMSQPPTQDAHGESVPGTRWVPEEQKPPAVTWRWPSETASNPVPSSLNQTDTRSKPRCGLRGWS